MDNDIPADVMNFFRASQKLTPQLKQVMDANGLTPLTFVTALALQVGVMSVAFNLTADDFQKLLDIARLTRTGCAMRVFSIPSGTTMM